MFQESLVIKVFPILKKTLVTFALAPINAFTPYQHNNACT